MPNYAKLSTDDNLRLCLPNSAPFTKNSVQRCENVYSVEIYPQCTMHKRWVKRINVNHRPWIFGLFTAQLMNTSTQKLWN